MDAALALLLLDWRGRCPYNQSTDYVFASAEKHGNATAVAYLGNVETHPASCKEGWHRKARSLARIQTLVRNTPKRER